MVILKILIGIANLIYCLFKLLPVKDKVVMISRQSNEVNSDFRLLGDELEKKGHEVVYLCRTLEGGANSGLMTRIGYAFHMIRQMYHLATSKVAVIDSYCPTVSILRQRKSLTVVQIWHSIGTMKSFGRQIFGKQEASNERLADVMGMHRHYTFACAAGKAYAADLAAGFGIPEDMIRIFTLPRVDLLKSEKYEAEIREKIFADYPMLDTGSAAAEAGAGKADASAGEVGAGIAESSAGEAGRKLNVVYAPTFRKDESGLAAAFKALVDSMDLDRYNLIVKLHPLSKVTVEDPRVIIDRKYSTFDMLFVADKLISDYSCVVYEAGVRDIPLYFYNFDMDNYDTVRGFNIDYSTLPGYTSGDPAELAADLDKPYDMEYFRQFMHKYVENTDDCALKLANELDKYMH